MRAPVIIYEDNHLLIVQKPPGFLSQPDGRSRPDLLSWAQEYLARDKPGRAYVGLVHRLDRSVGGVMALAKTSKAASRLSRQFRERSCRKVYLALVAGAVEETSGRLDDYLLREGDLTRSAGADDEGGRLCSLTWSLKAPVDASRWGGKMSLLEINLLTGFKHQIRAQLAAWGHPVLGDVKYKGPGGGSGPAIGLWAESLAIDHPTRPGETEGRGSGKERLIFRAEPVADLWPWSLMCP